MEKTIRERRYESLQNLKLTYPMSKEAIRDFYHMIKIQDEDFLKKLEKEFKNWECLELDDFKEEEKIINTIKRVLG